MNNIIRKGTAIQETDKVAILIHGRGASTASILSLADHLNLNGFALMAPEAEGNTWYPYSFMAPDQQNEPAFSKAIGIIDALVKDCLKEGIKSKNIYFIGFSQGACLTLEYTAQNALQYGGVIAFTGGLIGQTLSKDKYQGDFAKTPIFIGSSERDMHVPLSRIEESVNLLKEMGADVKMMIFKDTQHTIRQEEIDWVNKNIF